MSYVRKITAGGVTKDVKDSEALEASSVFPAYVKKTYSVGDKCTYNGRVKRCKVEIVTPEDYTEIHWEDAPIGSGLVEPSALQDAVDEWLEDHPEATTTVQDGSITKQKLDQNLQQTVDDVGDLKSIVNQRPSIEETDATDSDFDIADSQGYVIARFKDGHIKTKEFNSADIPQEIAAVAVGFEYKFSGTDLLIGYGYNSTHDAVVVFNCGRANDLFDFSAFKLKTKGTSLKDLATADLTSVWTSGSDMHGPFQFNATTDPDGYYASSTDPSFTGGNHTVTINDTAVKTASSKYVHYFADGKPVSSGYGRCSKFEIRWANNVQAYNCVKADGTGRTSLVEYHDMVFDGMTFNEEVTLIPSEEITMQLWYGLQSVSWGTTYTNLYFIDGTNRDVYASSGGNPKSGNAVTSGIVQYGTAHSLKMTIDTAVDLGKRTYYSGDKGAFTSSSKTYFYIIGGSALTMASGFAYVLRGSYRFYPVVS